MVLFLLGVAFTVIFGMLYFTGYKKYSPMIAGIDKNLYFFPETFIAGIAVVDMLKLNRRSRSNKTIQKLAEAFSRQYLEFNYMINIAAKITYFLVMLPFAFFLGALSKEIILTVVVILIPIFLALYIDMKLDTIVQERREEILMDLPNALSKLALLVNAGMILREAWKTVGESGSRKIYIEMQNASKNIALGYSEVRAYEEFGEACKLPQVKKFVSVLCQNLEKGGGELVHAIKLLASEAWEDKKRVAKQRGDSASTKLIIPVMIMFAGVLMMILLPLLSGMQM